jgi:hypothetical protein
MGSTVAAALEAFEPATRGAVEPGFAVGSRFKGSIRDGLNGTVGSGVRAHCGGRLVGARRPAAWEASSQSGGLSPV